jgi:tetratricopeptide (TPR) repeat protein
MRSDLTWPERRPAARRALAGAALAVCLALQANAQEQPSREDLNALIYYTLQGDSAAAAAELRRLQARFPDWTPPQDPSSFERASPSAEEVDAIYRAVAAKNVSGARNMVEDTRRRHPGWTPPEDLTALIDVEAAQEAFTAAIAARDLAAASRIARETAALRRCDRVNNVWLLAELQAAEGERAAALAAHRGVVSACTDFEIVTAALEKSAAVATPTELRALFREAVGRFGDREAELRALEARLLAGMNAAPAEAKASAPRTAAAKPAPRPARQAASPAAPASTLHGRAALEALPLTGDRRLDATVRAARNEDWAGCAEASTRPRSVDVLYQRSWCVYNLDRPLEALAGFSIASRGGLGPERTRDAAYGLALAYLALGATDDAAATAAAHDLTRSQRVSVERVVLDQRGVRAYEAGRHREAIAFFDALEDLEGSLRRDLAVLRGYSFIAIDEHEVGWREFRRLNEAMSTEDLRAALRTGRRRR